MQKDTELSQQSGPQPENMEGQEPKDQRPAESADKIDTQTPSIPAVPANLPGRTIEELQDESEQSLVDFDQAGFRAGFVNIVGRPNVGKSTLSNALVGEKLSVITSKAQTTRHRILGIVNGSDFQMIFSDTPGIIRDPAYKLHDSMNRFIRSSFLDADVMLFLTEPGVEFVDEDPVVQRLKELGKKVLVLINKIDKADPGKVKTEVSIWTERLPEAEIRQISALEGHGVPELLERVQQSLPEHPPYFPTDALTDRPERFFAAEIIREKILLHYKQEIPYSVEVSIESFEEEEKIIRMKALLFCNRKSQKAIIIGKGGQAIKKMGTAARKDLEQFFDKPIYLETFVKVREGWRDRDQDLRRFGYDE